MARSAEQPPSVLPFGPVARPRCDRCRNFASIKDGAIKLCGNCFLQHIMRKKGAPSPATPPKDEFKD